MRTLELPGSQDLDVSPDGERAAVVTVSNDGWSHSALHVTENFSLTLENTTDAEQLVMLERMAWTDQATTAAEVTALQMFRDLFASEALRPGEQISVGVDRAVYRPTRRQSSIVRSATRQRLAA